MLILAALIASLPSQGVRPSLRVTDIVARLRGCGYEVSLNSSFCPIAITDGKRTCEIRLDYRSLEPKRDPSVQAIVAKRRYQLGRPIPSEEVGKWYATHRSTRLGIDSGLDGHIELDSTLNLDKSSGADTLGFLDRFFSDVGEFEEHALGQFDHRLLRSQERFEPLPIDETWVIHSLQMIDGLYVFGRWYPGAIKAGRGNSHGWGTPFEVDSLSLGLGSFRPPVEPTDIDEGIEIDGGVVKFGSEADMKAAISGITWGHAEFSLGYGLHFDLKIDLRPGVTLGEIHRRSDEFIKGLKEFRAKHK